MARRNHSDHLQSTTKFIKFCHSNYGRVHPGTASMEEHSLLGQMWSFFSLNRRWTDTIIFIINCYVPFKVIDVAYIKCFPRNSHHDFVGWQIKLTVFPRQFARRNFLFHCCLKCDVFVMILYFVHNTKQQTQLPLLSHTQVNLQDRKHWIIWYACGFYDIGHFQSPIGQHRVDFLAVWVLAALIELLKHSASLVLLRP